MHIRTLAPGLALALALFCTVGLAACGGDDDTGGSGDLPATLPAVNPGPKRIQQDNLSFKPNSIAVYLGEKVTFTNEESTVHTVTVNGKNESGTMKKGDTFEFTPDVPGRFEVTCDFHPQMKATILVVPAPTATQ